MGTPMSRFLLVELDFDSSAFRALYEALMRTIRREVPHVRSVTDPSAISRATLDQWLLPADQGADGIPNKRVRR